MMVTKNTNKSLRKKHNHKKITFKLHAPEAQSVVLAGDFNSWDLRIHPLKKGSKGMWKIGLNLSPGIYEYRFLVDGQWQNDPDCRTFTPNPFGSKNCLVSLE